MRETLHLATQRVQERVDIRASGRVVVSSRDLRDDRVQVVAIPTGVWLHDRPE